MPRVTIGPRFPDVLQAARLGDDWAWTELWNDLAGPVTGYMRSRNVREPEDATAEVFADLARSIHRFAGTEVQFRSFVFTIAHSRLVDQHRWFRSRFSESLPAAFDMAAPGADPATVHEMNESQAAALAMLSHLTPEQAEVVVLRVLADLSLEQVAEITGRRVNAVKQLQHRAMERLRKETQGVTK